MILVPGFLYILLVLFLYVIPGIILFYLFYNVYCEIRGAPFVPTSGKVIENILKQAKLKKGQYFIELGCGDGRVVRAAVKKYQVRGLGIDLNPVLIFYSKLVSKKLKGIEFKRRNFYDLDFKSADVMFLFLLPRTLSKLKEKILRECRRKTLIISHGFKIYGFEDLLVSKLEGEPYPTYYYLIK